MKSKIHESCTKKNSFRKQKENFFSEWRKKLIEIMQVFETKKTVIVI